MKTFEISINITGKITVPDSTLRDLRIEAAQAPGEEGGDQWLHALHVAYPDDDDTFLQNALKNALRNIARNGVVQDIGGMGVGVRAAPATVTVSVPERIVTQVKERQQLRYVGTETGSIGGSGPSENIPKPHPKDADVQLVPFSTRTDWAEQPASQTPAHLAPGY